jgi:hypothetical protein
MHIANTKEYDVKNLTVIETGERLLLTPVSIDTDDIYSRESSTNRIHYYEATEFPPFNPDSQPFFYADRYLSISKKHRIIKLALNLWYRKIKPTRIALSRAKAAGKYFWRIYKSTRRSLIPIWVHSHSGFTTYIRDQLVIQDPEALTETYYLVPSQKYLKLRFEERLQEALDDPTDWGHEEAIAYTKWEGKMKRTGMEIFYIAERTGAEIFFFPL